MLSSFLRPAWRSLRRAPAFTVTASVTLLLGLGATIAMFSLINGVLLRPLPYREPERLVGAWHDLTAMSIRKANQTAATYFTYRKLARSLDGIGVYQESAANMADPRGNVAPQRVPSAFVSASLLPLLGVPPLVGRTFTDAEDLPDGPDAVILGEGLWRARFGGDASIIGRLVEVNGKRRPVIGVMPAHFHFPSAATQMWLPLQLDPNEPHPGGFSYDAVARLKHGISIDDAERDLARVLPRMVELSPNMAPGVSTQMLLDQAKPVPVLVPLRADLSGSIAPALWVLGGAAALVLLVACANVTNLILVRADARQRELAVREALGAGRARVLAHFFAESALIAAIAGTAALALAAVVLRALVRLGPLEIPRLAEVGIDATTVAFAAAISAVVAGVCSVIPAIRLGATRLASALREGGRGGTAGRIQQRVRSSLVAVQIALALVALAGSGLLLRTFQQLNAVRPGFDPQGVTSFWMSLPTARYPNDTLVARFYATLLDRAQSIPGVESVAITSRLPLMDRGINQNPLYPENDPSYTTRIPPLAIYTTTDGAYFRTMRIPLLAGRTFDRLERQSPHEVLISRSTATQFWNDPSGREAIGKRFRSLPNGEWYTVVGVVGDVHDTTLAAPPTRTVYFPEVPTGGGFNSQTRNTMALVVRTTGGAATPMHAVQSAVRDLDPTLPLFDVRPLRRVLEASMAQLSFTITMLLAAAVVTLVLGAVGLYGVMAYVIALRTRELSVRIALGASPQSVVAMLTKQGVLLTAVGIGVGLLLYAGAVRFLRTMLYGVGAGDPLTLIVTSLLLIGVALVASWLPARRTTRLDPADVLRAE